MRLQAPDGILLGMKAPGSLLTLVVLAAGLGSRYGGLKQLDPVGPSGELIIDYSVYDALRAGFERVVFVIRREIEELFRERIGAQVEALCDVSYVMQDLTDVPSGVEIPPDRTKPWGTAHAVYACRHVVDTPFAVINADDFYGRSAYEALVDHLRTVQDRTVPNDYCMVAYRLDDTLTEHGSVARGICSVDANGYLVEIRERTRVEKHGEGARYTDDGETWTVLPGDTTVSMNMWGFTPSLFRELEPRFRRFLQAGSNHLRTVEFLMPEVVGQMIREGRGTVKILRANERWFGATYRQDMAVVRQAIRDLLDQGLYPGHLWHRDWPGP